MTKISSLAAGFLGILSLTFAACALAATTTVSVALDTDNDPGTGCSINTSSGTLTGFEQILDTTAATGVSTGQIGLVTRRICAGGVFGAPITVSTGGWPIGLGNGDAQSDVIETFIPLADLASKGSVRLVAFTGQDVLIGNGSVPVPPVSTPPATPIPTLSPSGLVGLIALLGLGLFLLRRHAFAGGHKLLLLGVVCFALSSIGIVYAVIRDGQITDWTGISPIATDPKGDAPVGLDLVSLYAVSDKPNLSLRIDAQLARDLPVNQAPTVNAGNSQSITLPALAPLVGTATDDGLPNPPGTLTLLWTKDSGPGAVSFGDPGQAATTANFNVPGVYVLRLTANDSALSSSATVQITVAPSTGGSNTPPIVAAGNAQSITLPAMASLAGTATDDGLPNPPGTLTLLWTKDSGPGAVNFANPGQAATTAAFASPGVYVLRLTANDGALSSSAVVQITVAPSTGGSNTPPVVAAGNAQTITLPAIASLNATITDDGLPNPPGVVTIGWSTDSGPGIVTFANPNNAATAATFSLPGVYTLRVTANDGALSASSPLQVTVIDGAPLLQPIADRTIALGTRFQQLLVATDGNTNDTLTYSLLAAPGGAALAPSPLIDWTPNAAQLGLNTFTAQVTDTAGHAATTTFHVTVVQNNRPPQLATQINVILPVGVPFARTLTATDPDSGDVLTLSLVSGPAGMAMSGSTLTWTTLGKAPGDYAVTVKVTDSGGLVDQRSFTVTLQPSAAPVAVNDTYSVRLGQTLTVPVPGVLGNDLHDLSTTLSATKLTNPTKGTLQTFGADGSFTFLAPATLPAPVFAPVLRNSTDLGLYVAKGAVLIDLDGDGKPEVVFYAFNHMIIALHSDTGVEMWRNDASFFTGCTPYSSAAVFSIAAGDLDDDGKPEVVFPVSCAGDNGTMRYIALNGADGTQKWLSPALSAVPVTGDATALTTAAVTTIARLRVGETPSVLFNVVGMNSTRNAAFDPEPVCRQIVETVPNGTYQPNPIYPPHYQQCRGLIVLNGADGTVRQRMITERAQFSGLPDGGLEYRGLTAPVVVDLDGDGIVEIVAGGVVFNLDGTVRWKGRDALVHDLAVGNFDDTPDIEVVRYEGFPSGVQALAVYKSDGSLLWSIPFDAVTFVGKITVADIDGSGKPDILINYGVLLCAVRHTGVFRWCNTELESGVSLVDSRTRIPVFDLDGDGVPEVILQTSKAIVFLDGPTGKLKFKWDITRASTGSGEEADGPGVSYHPNAPLVGDVDADGHADVLFFWTGINFSAGRFTVLKAQNNDWRPARPVQNQFAYHVANVNDNGTIPTTVPLPNNFATPRTNVWGTQAQVLAPVDPRTRSMSSFTYMANDGLFDSAAATVAIDIAPVNAPPVFDSIPPTRYVLNGGLTYTAHAIDPDVGDSITYSLLYSSYTGGTCTLGAVTGILACTQIQYPNAMMIIVATDSLGAQGYQTLVMAGVSTNSVVPNVLGLSKSAAATTLGSAGLTVGPLTLVTSGAPVDQVLAQSPAAGTTVLTGEAVALSLSTGPAPVVMPFVVGQSLTQANAVLGALNLTVNVSTVFSTTIPVNQVMAQAPAPGTVVVPIPSNPALLTVSAGPPLNGTIAQVIVEPPNALRLTGEDVQYKATAVFTDGTSADVSLSSSWSSTATGTATVGATGIAHAVAPGSTSIRATLSGFVGQATLDVSAHTAGGAPPTAIITAPTSGTAITGPTTIVGTANDTDFLRYELAFALAGDTTWTVLAEGTGPVVAGTLGTIDPTTLINDLYTIRLTVYDRGGNQSVATSTVQLSGNMKLGLFSLSFVDLNLPLAGIPISLIRSYDSRDKTGGDFGIGWKLGQQTLRLRANRVQGTGWLRTVAGPVVSLMPTSEHKMSLTLGDGRVEEFDLQLSPTSAVGALNATLVTGYIARPGTLGTLQMLDNPNLLILNGGLEEELVDDVTLNTFDPKLFLYTTLEGSKLEIHTTAGVRKITDRNGNSTTFSPSGILHSTGAGIAFTRDAQGRIVQITDPRGGVQSYGYDGNGDLTSHTDAVGNTSLYKYNRSHGLIDIIDPSGNHPIRSDYDATGRLIAMTDANGNKITYTHNPGAQEELITDRRGRVTRLLYDSRGNVVSSEKGVTIGGVLVNAVISTTYDALNNETSTVNADGLQTTGTFDGVLPLIRSVDPSGLNLVSTVAYDAKKDVTSVVYPGNRTVAMTHDGNRNITGINSPATGATTSTSDGRGLPMGSVDAMGTTIVLTRDAAGNLVREEVFDAASQLLRRVEFTYDANANLLSETLYRTNSGVLTPLTTMFAYDASNRMVAETDSLGGIRRTEYDSVGRVSAMVDPLGRRTTLAYGPLGQRTRVTYPDGTFDDVAYDVDGNPVTQTDAAGRTTTHTYDELNRRIRTTATDGAFTQAIYSPGGTLDATIDARGNRTDFSYDSAGRRTRTTHPAVLDGVAGPMVRPESVQALSASGFPTAATDPNGNTTTYVYDAAGRLAQTIHPDGTSATQTYDVLGRRSSMTNEDGQTQSYTFDGLGRLTAASGVGGTASYSYDEAGNLLSETDAMGRTTRYRYDAIGRMIERMYPGGEFERLTYDAVGNVVTATDGSGQTSSYIYDSRDRPVQRNLPGGAVVKYAYNPDGQQAKLEDARGATTFGYDIAGRLSSVTHPGGETVTYSRDAEGNLLALAAPAATINYQYDALRRLVRVSAPEGVTQYYYDRTGNRIRTTAGNGIVSDSQFDTRNRLTLLSHKDAGNLLQSFAYAYSPTGRRTQVTESDGSVETYTYDGRGRLASQLRTGPTPLAISHSYDQVGNRTQTIRNGVPTSFSFNSNNQLLSDGGATYGYDANGNLATKTVGSLVTQYGYDPDHRLVTISGAGGPSQYLYDADGNRVQASTAAGTLRFLVDQQNATGLSQVLEEKDGNGVLQARFTYGAELLALNRGANPGFVHRDALGSVRALTNAGAAVTDRYRYDAFGATESAQGTTDNPYRYTGERFDPESGMYQLRARYYNPSLGRFISRDPLDGQPDMPISRNRYLYAYDDPVNHSDPTGLEASSLPEVVGTMGIEATIQVPLWVSRVTAACTAGSVLGQVDQLMFAIDVGIQVGIAVPLLIGAVQSLKSEVRILDLENKNATDGQIKRLTVAALGGRGSNGARYFGSKFAMEAAGFARSHKNSSSLYEFEWKLPPWEVKGAIGGKEKLWSYKFLSCGVDNAGEMSLETNVKNYGKLSFHDGWSGGLGGSAELAMKLELFGKRYQATLPLISVDGFYGGPNNFSLSVGAVGFLVTSLKAKH
ncbi:MAG: RHS repeat-associated core domain-containing protein [Betaproteobacteria bacterium]